VILISLESFSQAIYFERANPFPIETHMFDICKIPGTNRFLAVGSNASYMYTDDNSGSWIVNYSPANISKNIDLYSVSFVNENLGFMIGDDVVFLKSNDGGLSWEDYSFNFKTQMTDVYFLDEQKGFIGKEDTLMITNDGGLSWTQIPIAYTSLFGYSPDDIHFINDTLGFFGSCNNSNFYMTNDGGSSWDTVKIYHDIADLQITDFKALTEDVFIARGAIINWSSNSYHLLRSEDGGHSWSEVYYDSFNSMDNLYFIDSLTGFAFGSRVMYDNMIVKTTDGGVSWEEVNMCYNYHSLKSMAFDDSGYGISVGSYGQVIDSHNFGEDWDTEYEKKLGYSSIINCIEITENETVFVGTESYGGGVLSGATYRSIDKGNSWEKVEDFYPIVDFDFVDTLHGVGVAAYYDAITVTVDGGINWESKEIEGYDCEFKTVDMIDAQIGFAGGALNGDRILKTTDCWENYFSVNLPDNIGDFVRDIYFINDTVGFAVTDAKGFYLKTTDQGENWEKIYLEDNCELFKIHFVDENNAYLLGFNCLLKTTDGGINWNNPNISAIEDYYFFSSIDFLSADTGFMISYYDDQYIDGVENPFFWTTDGGNNWQNYPFENNTSPIDIKFFNNNNGLLVGNLGIVYNISTSPITDINDAVENDIESILKCYPNPVSTSLNIDFSKNNKSYPDLIEVYELSGRKLADIVIMENIESLKINVSAWKKGVYVFKPYSRTEIFKSFKVIVN